MSACFMNSEYFVLKAAKRVLLAVNDPTHFTFMKVKTVAVG